MSGPDKDLHLGHLMDEVQSVILEKRDLLAHHRAKKRPQEMIAITEYRLHLLTEVWRTLDRIDKGQPSPYPSSSNGPVKEKSVNQDGDISEDLDDDLSDGW